MSNTETYSFAFILDQQVGLRTQALNVRQVVSADPSITPTWVPVCYQSGGGLLTRLPALPAHWRGTLRGIAEIRAGLGQVGSLDAALWATWAAKSVPELVSATPSFLVMDMTPAQMEAMGELYGYSRRRARFLGGWKQRATMQLYRQAERLFPWSEWVARSLRDDYGVPPEKITPVSPGVDLNLYRPAPELRPSEGPVRLLFVGGDFRRKGGDLLLRWAAETQVRTPWELHIITRDGVPSADRVVVHRNIGNNSPELVRLYQQSDLFVLPTRADCYSLVAMEAMATGLPVVISRLGGIPEIVADGETGYLTEPDDYHALAGRLDHLVTTPALRQEMGAASIARARARFDCRASIGQILSHMKRI